MVTNETENRHILLQQILENNFKVVVTTSLFARAIDIPHVSLVINFDVPTNRDTIDTKIYQYRAGRTGRFGSKFGSVLTFVNDKNNADFTRSLKYELNVNATVL